METTPDSGEKNPLHELKPKIFFLTMYCIIISFSITVYIKCQIREIHPESCQEEEEAEGHHPLRHSGGQVVGPALTPFRIIYSVLIF